MLSAIALARHGYVAHEYGIRIPRIHRELAEVPSPPPEREITGAPRPRCTRIVRPKKSSLPRYRLVGCAAGNARVRRAGRCILRQETIDHRVDAMRIARRDRDARAADPLLRQPC